MVVIYPNDLFTNIAKYSRHYLARNSDFLPTVYVAC